MGFGMMKFVGNQHVDECYDLIKKMLEKPTAQAVAA